MTEKFEDVTVLGHPMLFTCLRVDRDTVPQGMYMYEVRHDDDQQGEPVQIANWIMVNHWGTLISNRPIRQRATSPTETRIREKFLTVLFLQFISHCPKTLPLSS